MKKREQIETKYKWDLTPLSRNDDEAYTNIKKWEQAVPKLASFKGKLGNMDSLYEYIETSMKIAYDMRKAYLYFSLKLNEDVGNPKYNKIMGEIDNISQKSSIAQSYVSSELLGYGDEYLKKAIADPRFKNNRRYLEELIRSRAHILDEKSKQIMAKVSHFAGDFGDIFDKFDAVDIRFDDVCDGKGKKHKLTTSNYSNHIESHDRVLRKNTWKSFYKSFIAMANTIGTNYIGNVKSDCAYADIYKYNSTLEQELFDDNVPVQVYENLITQVNSHLPLLHKYYRLKKRILGLKDFTYYDSYVSLSNYKANFPYEKDVDLVCEALKPMGQNYVDLIRTEVAERWVDVYPCEGKTTGGFETATYGVHPYILLNNTGTLDDCFTFAHETGHAMHSYFTNKTQPYELSDYTIMLAEVASTTNEVFLLKYLYANAKSKNEKLYYLDKYLSMFKSTIFRQTMFSEFEDYAHKTVESGGALTVKDMCDYYGSLNKKYHGKAIKHCKEIEYEWLRIPHFYRSYYVYKYATGLTSAICIASSILSDTPGARDNYYKYLSSGNSMYSLDTLKLAGVDLTTSHPYDVAFGEMEWALNELDRLTK